MFGNVTTAPFVTDQFFFSRATVNLKDSREDGTTSFLVMDGKFVGQCIVLASSLILLLVLYIYWNDMRLTHIPSCALYFSPKRYTAVDVHAQAERLATSPPIDDTEMIPPKTGRRYIIVGGVSCCYNYETKKGLFS